MIGLKGGFPYYCSVYLCVLDNCFLCSSSVCFQTDWSALSSLQFLCLSWWKVDGINCSIIGEANLLIETGLPPDVKKSIKNKIVFDRCLLSHKKASTLIHGGFEFKLN